MATIFSAKNYNDSEVYDRINYLRLRDRLGISDEICNPEWYSEITGIRELYVHKGLQEKADDMGIDWYSYWPDLERVEILE